MRSVPIMYFAFLLTVAVLSGCASDQFQQSAPTAKLVTQYAVLKYAERLPADQKAERVARIRLIATDVKALASGETTLLALQDAVNQQLDKAGLSPADRLLANGLVELLVAEIQRRVGEGVLSPEQRVHIVEVLDWIVAATRLA